jgi:hypothetical protein
MESDPAESPVHALVLAAMRFFVPALPSSVLGTLSAVPAVQPNALAAAIAGTLSTHARRVVVTGSLHNRLLAIQTAEDDGRWLFAALTGPELGASELGKGVSVVQTGVPDGDVDQAVSTARELWELVGPEVAVVTAGSGGAVVDTGETVQLVTAPSVHPRRFQGAGSVFSAAFLHAWRAERSAVPAARFACAAASLWCSGSSGPATRAEVLSFRDQACW